MNLRPYLLLALACSACQPVQQPLVDMTGVDHAKYNLDLADCYHKLPAFYLGNALTHCMKDKGYNVLIGF